MAYTSKTNPVLRAFRAAGGPEHADLDVGRFATGASIQHILHANRVFIRLRGFHSE